MIEEFEGFKDYPLGPTPWLKRVDLRTKAAVFFILFLLVICSKGPIFPLFIFLASFIAAKGVALNRKQAYRRITASLSFALVIILVQALFVGNTVIIDFQLAGLNLALRREGLLFGMLLASRVLGATSLLLVLTLTIPPLELFSLLNWLRLPNILIEIAALMYRYIFLLFEEAREIQAAQRLRLGYDGFKRAISSLGKLIGAVFLNSFEQSQRTYESMVARGYAGEYHFPPLGEFPLRDMRNFFAFFFLILSIFLLLERAYW